MKPKFQIIFFLMISVSSYDLWCNTLSPNILDALEKVLPQEIEIRQKLSLKENISTLFQELGQYAEDHAPLPESKNLTSTWTSKNDQQIIQTLVQNKDFFNPENEPEIQSYFIKRLRKISNETPLELWIYFKDISFLYPKNLFWLPFFENQLNQENFNWANLPNPHHRDWIKTTFYPILTQKGSTTSIWHKEILLNSLRLLQLEKNSLLQLKNEIDINLNLKSFLVLLKEVSTLIQMTDSRLNQMTQIEILSLFNNYFDFLHQFLIESETYPFILNSIVSSEINSNIIVESIVMQSFVFLYQQKKITLTANFSERIKLFVSLFQKVQQSIKSLNYQSSEKEKISLSFNVIFYLRSLINLKSYVTSTTESLFFSKGQWISKNQFELSPEYQWYESLVSSFNDLLQFTQFNIYKFSLIDNCYKNNLETPTCQSWREKFPLKLKEEMNDKGEKIYVWENISKNPLKLPPGQITLKPDEKLRIIAPELTFSFFTRIYAPSGNVEIYTNKLYSPWIDVSGQNGFNGFSSQTFPGQKPWIKKSSICRTRDYLEGVTLGVNPRKSGKIDWIGFSVKNPYPKNISVCASDIQMDNRDEVGDITKILDLGLPPENVSQSPPAHGESAGKIKLVLTTSIPGKSPLFSPLLTAIGGDGSSGKTGHDSPLCNNGKYQSFKVVLSHHKQWFQNWTNFQNSGSPLSLTSKGEYGDHWYGLFEVNLPRTSGSPGGNAGSGGEIELNITDGSRLEIKPNRWFLSPGNPGLGGKAGTCGSNEAQDGKEGIASTQGKLNNRLQSLRPSSQKHLQALHSQDSF